MNSSPTPTARGGSGATACRAPCEADPLVGKTGHNVCVLAYILGLISLHKQVSLITKKRGA